MASVLKLDLTLGDVFRPFSEPSRYKGAYGGRGSGKSWFFAQKVVLTCLDKPGIRIVCVREVQKSLKDSVKLLIEDSIIRLGVGAYFQVMHDHIITPGNGLILFQGLQDHTAESIKSLENFSVGYVEEAQTMTARSLEMLRPTIRSPDSELWFSWNPRLASDPVDMLLRGVEPPPDAIVVKCNYMDNEHFPEVLELERQYDLKTLPERYAHIWLGNYEPQAIGAIFNRQNINDNRRDEAPDMERIIVAIDPAVSAEERSDETGIIVVGKGADGRGYVLDDLSLKGTPEQWAKMAFAAYDAWEADAFVVEVNMGGDLVKHTLRSVRTGASIIEVRASRAKHIRAEPISALYAMGRISHVGSFPNLESQMLLFTAGGYDGEGSPDRADALVWGLTELYPRLINKAVRNAPSHAQSYSPHGHWRGK